MIAVGEANAIEITSAIVDMSVLIASAESPESRAQITYTTLTLAEHVAEHRRTLIALSKLATL
jgi:hypothetical protein